MMKIFSLLGVFLIFQCSAEPAAYNQCNLQCSNAKLAGPDLLVKPLSSGIAVGCSLSAAGTATRLSGPLTFKFLVGHKVNTQANTASSTATTKEGVTVKMEDFAPSGNVAFTPSVLGAMDVLATNPENGTITIDSSGAQTVTPSNYAGIETPKSQWCSDSCGVVTIQARPLCITGDLNVSILSGTGYKETKDSTTGVNNIKATITGTKPQ